MDIFIVLVGIISLGIPTSCQFPLYPYQDTAFSILSNVSDGSIQYYNYVTDFFGMPTNNYYITAYPDGVLALGPFQEDFVYTSNEFPLTGNETSIIAPFMADVDLSLGGQVWLSNFYDHHDDIFNILLATFPDANITDIAYLYGVTWENVLFFGSNTTSGNTFQAIVFIAYNYYDYYDDYSFDYQTYVMFNYGQLTWSTGINEGGDLNGLGGIPAQVGFNAGDGERFFTLPGSRTNEVLNLQTSSNIGIPGRWFFRVDEETIQGFSCREEGRIGTAPSSGVMVGGTKITIIGPCYSNDTKVVCKFGDVMVAGDVKSQFVAVCVSPACFHIGSVRVEVSLDDGKTFPFKGNFIYVSPHSVKPDVTRINPGDWLPCPNTYSITWEAVSLPCVSSVDIDVIGYCEPEGKLPFLTDLYQAGAMIDVNSGVFTIDCASFPSSPCNESKCNQIGAIRVRASEGAINSRPAIWSDFFPLRWLCGEQDSCDAWLSKQSTIVLADVPCPCTLSQAFRDGGRFQLITNCDCNFDDPINCADRCNNVKCFRASQNNSKCGGQECCYNSATGALSTDGGGFLYQAYQDGCKPYKSAGKVPWLSHLLLDVYPWFQCCRWAVNNQACKSFKDLRRGPSCAGFIPPTPAICTGDPHILTLDGNMYTFNGHGEFTMIDVGDGTIVLQARNLPTSNGQATLIKAVGACVQGSDGLHVEVRAGGGLDAWVNDGTNWEMVNFETSLNMPYNGFTITKGNNSYFTSEESLWIAYDFGLGLYFNGETGTEGVISIISTGIQPTSATKGLLGTWNSDPDDDFMKSDGTILPVDSTTEELHQFGISWRVNTSQPCLYYRPSETNEGFTNIDFIPNFDFPVNPSITPEMVEEVCGENAFCAFDFVTTGDAALAANTGSSIAVAMSVLEANEEAGVPCPPLSDPVNGNVVIDNANVGGSATYSCNRGFTLAGNVVRVCQLGSTWSGSAPTCVSLPPLSCIIQRPFVGIKEDESVFVYGLSGSQTDPDTVIFRRALNTGNGLGVPPKKESTVDGGALCEIPLSKTQRGRRFGVFACETIENECVTNSVKAVITSARKRLLPFDGRVTQTVNVGEKVQLRVTRPNGPLSRLRWTKDSSWEQQWYRRPVVTLKNARLTDEGVYEIFQRGRRSRGLQAIIILYVRGCPRGFYGSNCDQVCTCQNGGLCDESTGECTCPPGFSGTSCEGTYTVRICSTVFGNPAAKGCRGILFCQSGKFGCLCGPGYFGIDCKQECPRGTYGAGCTQTCDGNCDSKTGE